MAFAHEESFIQIMGIIRQAGSIPDVVVIGSWAEFCYFNSGLLGSNYYPLIKTMDVDILIPSIPGPSGRGDIAKIAREAGFSYDEDRISGSSRLYGPDDFECEFLTPQRGDGHRKLPRSSCGVNAQQLTHLGILVQNVIYVDVRDFKIPVPSPEAYVVQKMLINERRGFKALADRKKIENLLQFITIKDLMTTSECLTKKEKDMFTSYINKYVNIEQDLKSSPFDQSPECAEDIFRRSEELSNKKEKAHSLSKSLNIDHGTSSR